MQAPWVVGLTGGIGSGKSAAAKAFAKLGIHTVDADDAARWVVEPGQPALQALVNHFGEKILHADSSLNRAALRELIFTDAEQRLWVEQLLHPLIRQAIEENLAQARSAYALLVSPLLIESGQHQRVERVIVVDVPTHIQVERTLARDKVGAEQVQAILAAQMPREQRLSYADDILSNHGNLNELEAQVAQLHKNYLQLLENPHD